MKGDEKLADQFEEFITQFEQVMIKVVRRLGHEVGAVMEEGMTPPQFFVLRMVGHGEAAKVSEIAEKLGVTLSAVTSLCDRLAASGLLNRERDQADRRVLRLTLTDTGRRKLTELEAKRSDLLRRYLGGVPQAELEHLLVTVRWIALLLEETPGDR